MKYAYIAVFVLFYCFAGTAQAAERTWVGRGSTQMASDGRNWQGEQTPVSGDALNLPSGFGVIWDLPGVTPVSVATAANVTLRETLTVTENLTIAGGTFDPESKSVSVGGDLAISGGSFAANGSTVTVSGDWKLTGGDVQLAASAVVFTGSAPKTIASGGKHFGDVMVNATNSTITLADPLNVDGTLTIGSGNFSVGSGSVTTQGGIELSGGSLTVGTGALNLTGTAGRPLLISSGSAELGTASTVNYQPVSGTVTVAPLSYGNLALNGNAIFSLAGETTVAGRLSVGENATLVPSGNILNVPSGAIANAGRIMAGLIRAPAVSLGAVDANGAAVGSIGTDSTVIYVRLEDPDLNRNGAAAETASGLTVTTLGGDREIFGLKETAAASGAFLSGAAIVHRAAVKEGNGQIEVGQNDIIFLNYLDSADPSDAKTVQVAVTLSGESTPGLPQIADGPHVGNFSAVTTAAGTSYLTHITWSTDLVGSSSVEVTAPGEQAITAGSLAGVTFHDVTVTGLERNVTYGYTVSSMTADGKIVRSAEKFFVVMAPGDRIMSDGSQAVYWYLNDKRNVFADFTSYDSWFPDWNGVVVIPPAQMADIPLGRVVPIRGGTYLVKIQSDPKVYAAEPCGRLRWVPTEAIAAALYGTDWAKRVRDVDVSQFVSYTVGEPLAAGSLPENYYYRIGTEWNAVVGTAVHPLSDFARTVNNVSGRFLPAVSPATVAVASSGATLTGYVPELNGVFVEGNAKVFAPAFGG